MDVFEDPYIVGGDTIIDLQRPVSEELRKSAGVIREKTVLLNSEYMKLYSEIQNLQSRQWQGVASEAYNVKIDGYRFTFEAFERVSMDLVNRLIAFADSCIGGQEEPFECLIHSLDE